MKKTWKRRTFILICAVMLLSMVQVYAKVPTGVPFVTQEWEVLKIVNRERYKENEEPLTGLDQLQQAADMRAEELRESFSHTRPDDTTCFTVLREVGLSYGHAGENIATRYGSPESVMDGWMNSSGHRANILQSDFMHVGVGYTESDQWVQIFIDGSSYDSFSLVLPKSMKFQRGTTIEEMGIYAVLSSETHDVCYLPIISEYCSGFQPNRTGKQTVTVSVLGYTAKFDATIQIKAPSVTASNVASSGKIRLTWDVVEGAEKYQIYRSASKNGKYSLMKTVATTSYTNTSAKAGEYYYYYVVAVDATGETSKRSNIVGRTCDLARPTVKLCNDASSGKVKISWEAVDGAVKYKVYRATSKNGDYSLMKTVTGTSMVNANGVTGKLYYYKVKAIAENSNANSVYSEVKSRVCDLPSPTVSITRNENGKPKLTWDPISGASSYEVYRATKKDGEYKLLKTVSGTRFTNPSAKAGKTYYYMVKAIHTKSTANSAYSDVVSIKSN